MSAPDRIWVEADICQQGGHGSTAWPEPDEDCEGEIVYLLSTPEREHAAELAEALREIRGMTDEAVRVPAAAERWLDRIEEVCISALAKLDKEADT